MPTPSNTRSRQLSYANPVMYNGSLYPSTEDTIEQNGNVHTGRIFADNSGQYFTINSQGHAVPATVQNMLPEVTVLPSRQDMLADSFNGYLTMSNDNTRVFNSPHREYNPHLTSRTIRGAKEHNLWEQQHPNASSWSYAAAAAPFAVAAAPAAISAGQALAGTSLGQAAIHGIERLMATPVVEAVNTGLGLGSAVHGVYDVTQGRFTPSTALELAGGLPIAINQGSKALSEILPYTKRKGIKNYTKFINSEEYRKRLENAGLEDHWSYMKNLTDRQIGKHSNVPFRKVEIIDNDPFKKGMSDIHPLSPYYGVTIKKNLPDEEIRPTIDHEFSHWATGNATPNDIVNIEKVYTRNVPYGSTPLEIKNIGDVMRYDESIAPTKSWENVLEKALISNPNMTISKVNDLEDRYWYLIDPQEKRARAYALYRTAKNRHMTTDKLVDSYTLPNGEISSDAPEQLQDMAMIFPLQSLKKYLNHFLGLSLPIGMSTTISNQNK